MIKSTIIFLICLTFSFLAKADDTAALQALLNAGTVTLPSGHATYIISGTLNVTHAFHLNANTIQTNQTAGAAIRLNPNTSIDGGAIIGNYNPAVAPVNTNYGIAINGTISGSSISITNMTLLNFPTYGINCSPSSNLTITGNHISATGLQGFYFDPEVTGTGNSVFSNNVIDRSMISPTASNPQSCVGIRGSSASPKMTVNWTITNNVFKMPHLPSNASAECGEYRHMKNSTITGNICDGGTIGISAVADTNILIANNHITSVRDCGIEFAGTYNCSTSNNYINGSNATGILIDGYATTPTPAPPSFYTSLSGDTIRSCVSSGVHCFTNTKHVSISGLVIYNQNEGIDLQQTDSVTVNNTFITGQGFSNTTGIFFDSSPGHLTYNFGSLVYLKCAIGGYSNILNYVTDNVHIVNTILTGTTTEICSSFINGGRFGSNVTFLLPTLIFNPLPTFTYGIADTPPGATSALPITYSSSNTSVATIISGKIHVTGTGSANITANNGDTTITRPLTISKAALAIIADSKTKNYGSINPALTTSYSGFVYSETSSVLTSTPSLSTTALTSSLPGAYPISVSGGSATNYNITRNNGMLTILTPTPTPGTSGFTIKKKSAIFLNHH